MLATPRVVAGEMAAAADTTAASAAAARAPVESHTVSPPAKRKRVAGAKNTSAGAGKRAAKVEQQSKDEEEEEDDEEAHGSADGPARDEASGGANGGGGSAATETPAEPVKRKRGRRKLIHDEEERKLRRKMQCKLNQRRYRARQRGVITTLSLESEKMSEYLQELEAYHRFLYEFDNERSEVQSHEGLEFRDKRPQIVVNHFVRVFRHGFALHSVEVAELQENFLHFAMDKWLVSQGAMQRGVEALILQLKRYTSYHAVFEVQPESFEVVDARTSPDFSTAIVQVSGKLHLRISRDTVMLLYPHIIDDEELNARVVGHEIYPTFSMVFHFNEQAKVSKFDFVVDFAQAFLELLGSVPFTTRLLERAIITPFAELGVDPHGELDAAPKANKQLSLKFILL